MAITKAKKQLILDKLESIKNDSGSLVFVGFSGMEVSDANAMRSKLREEGVGYFVAKKTLMRRTLDGAFEGDMPTLDGEVAIAHSLPAQAGEDLMAPAQNVRAFEKQYADNIAILGGVFDGVYKNKAEMTEIASIPGLTTLRGMFVNVINSPIQGFAVTLSQIAEKQNA